MHHDYRRAACGVPAFKDNHLSLTGVHRVVEVCRDCLEGLAYLWLAGDDLPVPCQKSILVLDSNTPTAISRPLGRAQDAATKVGSAIRRLLGRAHNAWENGSLWVALVFGMGYLPPPPLVLLVDTTIVASGAAIGAQVSAAIAFVVAMLAVVEITLVSNLVAPAKTQAVLRPLHDWARAHRRQVLVVFFAVVGFWQVAKGMGIV